MPAKLLLDLPTLVICSHLVICVMALTLALTAGHPMAGQPGRVLRLWMASLLVLMLPEVLLALPGAPGLQQRSAWLFHGCWAACTALQWSALRELRGSVRSPGRIAAFAGLLLGAGAWLTGAGLMGALAGLQHAILPFLSVGPLRTLFQQGRGGAAAASAIVATGLPPWFILLAGIGGTLADPSLVILVNLICSCVASLGLLSWQQDRIHQLLLRTAVCDALTGALNRHGLLPLLESRLASARRQQQPLSLALCDLDHFKRVNDVHGHAVGDEVLKAFVARAQRTLRPGDSIGRWGGEEFLIVLPDTSTEEAVRVMERLRRARDAGAQPLPPHVTFSAGVATTGPGRPAASANDVIRLADQRLYIAKRTRDRVISASPEAAAAAAEHAATRPRPGGASAGRLRR